MALIGFTNQINIYRVEDFLKKFNISNNPQSYNSFFKLQFLVYRNDDIIIDLLDRVYLRFNTQIVNNQIQININQFFQFFKFPPPFSTFAGYTKNLTYTLETPILLKKGDVIKSVVYYHKTYEEVFNFPFVLVCSNLKEHLDKARNVVLVSGDIFDLDRSIDNNFFTDEIKINSINNITKKFLLYFINYELNSQTNLISYASLDKFNNNYLITRISLNKVFGLSDPKFPFVLRRPIDFIEVPVNYKTDYTHYEISFSKRGSITYNSVFTGIFEIEKL